MATRDYEPHSRETRIAQAMMAAAEAHPDYAEGDRTIVLYYGPEMSGIAHGGYEDSEGDDTGAMADLFMSLHAIFEANGKRLSFVSLPERGEG